MNGAVELGWTLECGEDNGSHPFHILSFSKFLLHTGLYVPF